MPEDKTIPVHVAVRIRPLVPKELGEGCQECATVTSGEPQIVIGNNKAFTFDYVYGTTSKQSDLYTKTVVPLLDGFFKGYNATVLAYGQTGSGKTYSMGTGFTMCTNSDNKDMQGVIPRVVQDLFTHVDSKKEETEFLLKVSFLEIHNEEVHDLLNPASTSDKISVREDCDGGIRIAGLTEKPVTSGEEMVKFLCNGSGLRATGATAMNSTSSRSHAIFSIIMEQRNKTGDGDIKRAKFHLVDLAGSERAKKTNAQGDRFKEGVNINKGLLALGNVISALSDEQRKSNSHVPYRDSKLTRLLQDSLGGNSNTVMLACVSPADSNYEETLNTLRYADRARQIKNKPIVNRDPVAAEMAKLKQQVQMLQLQLHQGQTMNGSLPDETGNGMAVNVTELADRISQLEEENKKLSEELHNSVDQNTKMFEKVLMAELSRDKLIRKYDELKHFITENEIKLKPNLEVNNGDDEQCDLAAELQKKFQHFEESCEVTNFFPVQEHDNSEDSLKHDHSYEAESLCQDNSNLPSTMNSTFESQHALRQAELGRQVQELTKALSLKQELAVKMQQNEGAMNVKMAKQYEVTVRDLESEINKLEKEKASLAIALNAAKTSTHSNGSSKPILRIKELESKIVELKKKQVELQKLQRLKQQNDATITKLNSEISNVKSTRVKLMRHMKEESERFRTLKKEKENEIIQLKQQDRKRQFQYSKLQNVHQKQQAVLKRKTEEVASANRRLHDALNKRKEAADKRDGQQHLQNKQTEGLIPRMKSWLSHEIEVLVSIAHAKKTLEELIEDRKTISRELSEVKGTLQDDDEQPPAKKMLPMRGKESVDEKEQPLSELQQRANALNTELKLKTSQIAELQQKLCVAENHGDKSKHRWNNIHTMAEAKASLQVLLSMTVDARSKQIKMEKDLGEHLKELSELRITAGDMTNKYRLQLERVRRDYDQRATSLQKEHEDKVLLILDQIPSEEEKANISRQQEIIQLKEKQLKEMQREMEILQQKFYTLSEAINNDSGMAQHGRSTSEKLPKVENMVIDVEDETPHDEEENVLHLSIDDLDKDPDWVKTPLCSARTVSSHQTSFCACRGKCVRNCKCRDGNLQCGVGCGCGCVIGKCLNRPRDPMTPFKFDSSDSEMSVNQAEFLKILASKSHKKKRISKERVSSSDTNTAIHPKQKSVKPEKLSNKRGQENKVPKVPLNKKSTSTHKKAISSTSSTDTEKGRKNRRKSGVLSKKQGIKNASSRPVTTPHRSFLRTPGSPKMSANQKATKATFLSRYNTASDVENKQRKRKLRNPSKLPGFIA